MVILDQRLRTWLPLALTVILLLLHIFSPSRATFFIMVTLLCVHLVSYYWARELAKGLHMQRMHRYGWAQVGDVIEERFVLHNDSWLPAIWLTVYDKSNLPGYHVSRATGIGGHSSIRWSTEGFCERRGIYTLGPTELYTGDPFGLFEIVLKHDYHETFVVYPPIAALPRIIEPRGLERGDARTHIRTLDLTTNFASVRQYVPGDALNRIAWRTTARRSTSGNENIFVKEFDLEPSGDIWFFIDMDRDAHFGQDADSSEELAVVLAASLANQMLRDNHAVGLASYDGESLILPPRKGHDQLWEILRILAGIHASSPVSLSKLIELSEPVINRGVTVTLLTPSFNPDWVGKVGSLLRRGTFVTAI
ncbi:MAG: DUF58 domain-containing protein, partial [Chloroflexi bacterium]|nr:DUF58 domain-containing protein [Chloroflexota bacterium]